MKKKYSYLSLMLGVLAADQLAKYIVVRTISRYQSITVIPGFMNLTHIRNRGAIFGFFSQDGGQLVSILLTLGSLFALCFVIFYFIKTPLEERSMLVSLSLILGGALGNLVDRVFKGYVVDFVDFYIKRSHWPSFNVADASISIGAILLIFILLKGKPREKCILNS